MSSSKTINIGVAFTPTANMQAVEQAVNGLGAKISREMSEALNKSMEHLATKFPKVNMGKSYKELIEALTDVKADSKMAEDAISSFIAKAETISKISNKLPKKSLAGFSEAQLSKAIKLYNEYAKAQEYAAKIDTRLGKDEYTKGIKPEALSSLKKKYSGKKATADIAQYLDKYIAEQKISTQLTEKQTQEYLTLANAMRKVYEQEVPVGNTDAAVKRIKTLQSLSQKIGQFETNNPELKGFSESLFGNLGKPDLSNWVTSTAGAYKNALNSVMSEIVSSAKIATDKAYQALESHVNSSVEKVAASYARKGKGGGTGDGDGSPQPPKVQNEIIASVEKYFEKFKEAEPTVRQVKKLLDGLYEDIWANPGQDPTEKQAKSFILAYRASKNIINDENNKNVFSSDVRDEYDTTYKTVKGFYSDFDNAITQYLLAKSNAAHDAILKSEPPSPIPQDSDAGDASSDTAKLNAQIDELNQKLKESQTELVETQKKMDALLSEKNRLENENANNQSATEELKRVQSELENTKNDYNALIEVNNRLKNEASNNVGLSEQLQRSQSELEETKNKIIALAAEKERLENEASAKQGVIEELNKVQAELEETKNKAKETGDILEQTLSEKKALEGKLTNITEQNANDNVNQSTKASKEQLDREAKAFEKVGDKALDAAIGKDEFVQKNREVIKITQKANAELEKEAELLNAIAKNALKTVKQRISKGSNSSQDNKTPTVDIQSYENVTAQYERQINKLNKRPEQDRSREYVQNLSELKSLLSQYKTELNAVTNSNIVTGEQLSRLDNLREKLTTTSNKLKDMTATEKGATDVSRYKLLNNISKYLKENSGLAEKFKRQLRDMMTQLQAPGADAQVKDVAASFFKLQGEIRAAGQEGKRFWDVIKEKAFYGLAAQIGTYFSFYDIINGFRQGIEVVKELDSALTEMRKVSDESLSSLKAYQKESFNIAKGIGSEAAQVQKSTADFMKLGYSLKQASQFSKDANVYANVGDMNIDEATEHMISSIQAWKSEFNSEAEASTAIVDRYNEIGNRFAITSADIGSAMERSGAALKAGGNTLNESIGLITAGNLIQQEAETTASALKIMSLRIRGAKADLSSMGEETDNLADSTSKMQEEIKALSGVDIMKDADTFKGTAEIIKELGPIWDKLTDVSRAAILEKLAGKNRASTIAGLIENYETIDEVIKACEESEGSATRENERHIESVEGRIQKLTTEVQRFWYTFLGSDTVKTVTTNLTNILSKITDIIDKVGTLPALLATVGAGLAFKNIGRAKCCLQEYAYYNKVSHTKYGFYILSSVKYTVEFADMASSCIWTHPLVIEGHEVA